jgi:hypothetical protein
LIIWNLIVGLTKSILAGFMWIGADYLGALGAKIFRRLDPYPRVELVVVMFIVPLIMNAFQFWVQDNFLKKDVEEEQFMLTQRMSLSFQREAESPEIVPDSEEESKKPLPAPQSH